MEQKLDLILKKLEELDLIKQELHGVKSQMNDRFISIETRSSFMESKLDDVNQKLDTIYKQVANNTEQLHKIENSQEHQKKALETLALRSIEQESELRELKRIK